MSNDNNQHGVRRLGPRTRRFRLVCYCLAALFVTIGGVRLAASALTLVDPLLTTASFECDPCGWRTDPILLLEPETARRTAARTPGTEARILALVAEPEVKQLLFLARGAQAVPFFFMFMALALALRHFARAGFDAAGVRWIRRAALAAVFWTLAQPLSMSIRWTALSPITHGGDLRHVVFGGYEIALGILIAGAAWAVAWAMEEGLDLRRDLENYV